MPVKYVKRFQDLSVMDACAFLARHHTGRIAFSLGDNIDIQPLSYSFDHGWILGRTSIGTKLATLLQHPWCAFEADEVAGPFEWTSVVAKGAFHLLDPEYGSPDVYDRALSCVRALVPSAFSFDDPEPHRSILFGIYVNEICGRSMREM
jgi:uncharacterized protein